MDIEKLRERLAEVTNGDEAYSILGTTCKYGNYFWLTFDDGIRTYPIRLPTTLDRAMLFIDLGFVDLETLEKWGISEDFRNKFMAVYFRGHEIDLKHNIMFGR